MTFQVNSDNDEVLLNHVTKRVLADNPTMKLGKKIKDPVAEDIKIFKVRVPDGNLNNPAFDGKTLRPYKCVTVDEIKGGTEKESVIFYSMGLE